MTTPTFAISVDDVVRARERIRSALPITPLTHSPHVSESTGREVYFKWDCKHRTGSFKERGACNCLLSLSEDERARGVCAASAGNHALALSYHAARLGIKCHIVMPKNAAIIKVQSTRKTGADVILHGATFAEAYEFAQKQAAEKGYNFISAFDHPAIMAGQGTLALELLEQLADFDSIIIPVGGGGIASGIATVLKARRPEVYVLGAMSEWLVQARQQHGTDPRVRFAPVTIADGIAVKTVGMLTTPILNAKLDKLVAVSETDIASAIVCFLEREKSLVEGAGAAALAALLTKQLPPQYKKPVVVVSGGNIDVNVLSRLLEGEMAARGRLLRLTASGPDVPGSLHTLTGIIATNGANVLEVFHDRAASRKPGLVDISFVLEVRDHEHKAAVVESLSAAGCAVRED